MYPADFTSKPTGICPHCGAAIQGPGVCWLCHAHVEQPLVRAELANAAHVDSPFAQGSDPKPVLLWSTLATFGMIGLVGIGTSLFDQWIGIVYWLVVAPAAVAIASLVLSYQAKPGSGASTGLKVVSAVTTVFVSIIAGIAIGAILVVVAIVALIESCFHTLGLK